MSKIGYKNIRTFLRYRNVRVGTFLGCVRYRITNAIKRLVACALWRNQLRVQLIVLT